MASSGNVIIAIQANQEVDTKADGEASREALQQRLNGNLLLRVYGVYMYVGCFGLEQGFDWEHRCDYTLSLSLLPTRIVLLPTDKLLGLFVCFVLFCLFVQVIHFTISCLPILYCT